MSGPIFGGAPWTREAVRTFKETYPDQAAAIEQAIPDDYHILVTAGYRPGQWGAKLVHDFGLTAVHIPSAEGHRTIAAVCWAAISRNVA